MKHKIRTKPGALVILGYPTTTPDTLILTVNMGKNSRS